MKPVVYLKTDMDSPVTKISQYIVEVDKLYRAGNATEHSYRPALKTLLESITTGLTITNEPKHIECGAPDYIVTKNGMPLGYIEAKDIKTGLNNKANKEQFDRYKQSLGNLIITDYLTFQLFVDSEPAVSVSIGSETNGGIAPDKKQFPAFLELINQFTAYSGKTIYSSEQLAKMMADKTKLLAEVIKTALKEKPGEGKNDSLDGQYEGFKEVLMHDLTEAGFADIYAQTLAYGLFAARLNQTDSQPFTRLLAAQLIPQSNPFLRKFFQYIAGYDLDARITWIVNALADLFNCAAVDAIKQEFGRAEQDPYIHFYETFLAEYDPAQREMRGVYYTPVPVVKFIVQAVDDILKSEFGLPNGLADYSKVKRTVHTADGKNKTAKQVSVELHKVQILDPAAGTGTFLAEVIDKIYSYFAKNKGAWRDYCEKHLIPRLHGFEILMASYAMAHFKLDMILKETGFSLGGDANKRFHVYLTNTLEEAPEKVPELFMARWLAQEAEEAGRVKRDAPVMVVIANPPYNVSTQNRNEWIDGLIADYKKDLNEKKLNLDDDYIKFIRYGQYLIEKNGFGILAYISNNSFIDGITHRTMRKTLLEVFDTIYILDLHGNARKKETAPDGGVDENVFDIMQGTSINIFIKTGKQVAGSIAQVYHGELFGRRESKYQFLYENKLSTIKWEKLIPEHPYFFFVPKNFNDKEEYEKGFSLTGLFTVYNNGIKTDRDSLFIDFDKQILEERIRKLLCGEFGQEFKERYHIWDSGHYRLIEKLQEKIEYDNKNIKIIQYRPFDMRYIYYEHGLTSNPAYKVMRHFIAGENIGLVNSRQFGGHKHFICHITNGLIEISSQPYAPYTVFPLYLYPDENTLDPTEPRRPNLNVDIVNKIAEKTGLLFTPEKQDDEKTFSPVDLLDYIYAVLYSSKYREKHREFLKIDFPRVPYPSNGDRFRKLSAIGSLLRGLHLMENVHTPPDLATFPITGTGEIEKQGYAENKVWINKNQYFENVSREAWEYYIGGYQPAQKWLKDRKGQVLSFDSIEHYRKIIFVLAKTIEIQQQIDEAIE